jgi:hypothetical protein
VTTSLRAQPEYDVKARRISGTRAEKLEQIDAAIQELLDIKALECLAGTPHVQFLAVPRPRRHAFAMTVTILVLFIALVLLIGVRTSHAHDTDTFGFSPTAPNIAGADWLRRLGPTDVSYLAPVGKGLTVQGSAPVDCRLHPGL